MELINSVTYSRYYARTFATAFKIEIIIRTIKVNYGDEYFSD